MSRMLCLFYYPYLSIKTINIPIEYITIATIETIVNTNNEYFIAVINNIINIINIIEHPHPAIFLVIIILI